MGNLLKQAQDMQARMAKIQEELANKTVEGSPAAGWSGYGHASSTSLRSRLKLPW